jgi:hypothetical protein
LSNWYWKLKQRRGSKRAVVALGRKMLTVIYALLTTGELYDESHFSISMERQTESKKRRLIAEAKKLGLELVAA